MSLCDSIDEVIDIIYQNSLIFPCTISESFNVYEIKIPVPVKKLKEISFVLRERKKTEKEIMNENIEKLKLQNEKNEIIAPKISDSDKINTIYRCPEKNCFLTPNVNITKNNNFNFIIKSHCRNNHTKDNLSIKEFLSLAKKNTEDINCNYCSLNIKQNKNIRLYYCNKCDKFIFNLEKFNNEHEIECKNKILIELDKIDSDCNIHGKNLIYFCQDCNVSFCSLCDGHNKHNTKLIDAKNSYNKYKNELILKIKNNLEILNSIYNEGNKHFKNFLLIYEENKKLLEVNLLFLENLTDNVIINGEINKKIENSIYIKKKELQSSLEFYEKSFNSLNNDFMVEFFESNKDEQNKLLLWFAKIPVIINFKKKNTGFFSKGDFKVLDITKKYLLPSDTTISFISSLLRKEMKVDEGESCFCLVDGKYYVGYELKLSEVYEKYKPDDGYLHITFVIGQYTYG